eukprot:4248410-Prorocentrum_lima.AAC.1
MTSSLVGSEMCIRDRIISQESVQDLALVVGLNQILSQASQQVTIRKGTVSYTHLTLPTICSV